MNQNKKSSHKITLPTYLAYNATEPAQRLITTKYGFPRARNVKELEHRLAQIISGFGSEGLREVAKIHPDRDLVLHHNAIKMMEGGRSDNGFYNNTGLPPDPMYVYRDSGVLSTHQDSLAGDWGDWGDVNLSRNMMMRRGNNYNADGSKGAKLIGAGTIILSVLALGTLFVAFGERRRAN